MSTSQDLHTLVTDILGRIEGCSLKAAAKQCLADIASRDNPTTAPYERPLILDLPKPKPNVNIQINFGKE